MKFLTDLWGDLTELSGSALDFFLSAPSPPPNFPLGQHYIGLSPVTPSEYACWQKSYMEQLKQEAKRFPTDQWLEENCETCQ